MVKKYLFLLFALVAMCSCGPARVETGHNEHSILEKYQTALVEESETPTA